MQAILTILAVVTLLNVTVQAAPAPPTNVRLTVESASSDAVSYGCVGDGVTDNTPCIRSALAAIHAAGGGQLNFPASSACYLTTSQILMPNDGASPQPNQVNIKLAGVAGGAAWYGHNAACLDIRYTAVDGNAKIETRGRGTLMIEGLTIKDGGPTNPTPLLHSTNTTVIIERSTFIGSGHVAQDAIVLGGTETALGAGVNAPFQGYGTRIVGNHFRHLNRGVYGLNYANAVLFSANSFQGNVGTIAIEFDGSHGGGQADYGNQITHNVIEMDVYQYAVKFTLARENELIGNQMHDPGANTLAYYLFQGLSTQNRIVCGASPITKTFMVGEAASLASTTVICAESGMLESSRNGPAASEFAYGLSVKGRFDKTKNWPGPLTISDLDTPRERISIGWDHPNILGVIDVSNTFGPRPLLVVSSAVSVTGTLQAGVTATDPGCTTTAHIGKRWYDTTTTTTVVKECLSVAGTVTWVAK